MSAGLSDRLDRWANGWVVPGPLALFAAFEAITLPILQRSPGGTSCRWTHGFSTHHKKPCLRLAPIRVRGPFRLGSS
jgi:hypothetical protein